MTSRVAPHTAARAVDGILERVGFRAMNSRPRRRAVLTEAPAPAAMALRTMAMRAAALASVAALAGAPDRAPSLAACEGPAETCGTAVPRLPPPPPQHGPKELMRQRMLASKHRRQGVAALQSGEAAAALAALSEAQALTPDDSSLAPLVQRAQVMLGRHEAGVGAANAAHGRADEEDGSPRPAEPAPLPPRATAGAADALPEGWAEGSLEGTPFYYPVSDPSRIQWSPPLAVPPMPPTTPTPTTPTTPTTRPPYEEDGSPRPAEPAPLPPRATAGAADALPEGWAEGSLEGTPFYYPVSDPSRIQWSPPLAVPPMPPPPTAPTTTPPPTPTTTPTTPTTMRPSSHTGGTAPRSASRTTREDRQLQEEPSDVEEPPRVFYQVDGGGAVAFRRSPE